MLVCHFAGVLAMLLATALVMLTTYGALAELQNRLSYIPVSRCSCDQV